MKMSQQNLLKPLLNHQKPIMIRVISQTNPQKTLSQIHKLNQTQILLPHKANPKVKEAQTPLLTNNKEDLDQTLNKTPKILKNHLKEPHKASQHLKEHLNKVIQPLKELNHVLIKLQEDQDLPHKASQLLNSLNQLNSKFKRKL